MRQVIRRFLKHLVAEKNASPATITSYGEDLQKFCSFLVQQLGSRFLPGDVSREHVRDYLVWLAEVGHKRPNSPSTRARVLAAIRSFFKYAHRAGLLRDNPAADIPLPRIRPGEVRALSQEECNRLLRAVTSLSRCSYQIGRRCSWSRHMVVTSWRLRTIGTQETLVIHSRGVLVVPTWTIQATSPRPSHMATVVRSIKVGVDITHT
jgi:integrase